MAATARTRPSRRKRAVLLAPGAGADRTHHTLVALEAALAPVPVRRMDFTYRKEGRRVPDREPKLLEAGPSAVGCARWQSPRGPPQPASSC